MNAPTGRRPNAPIGVIASLATGFDRITARPLFLLPSFVLDLFLWLGPALRITGLTAALTAGFVAPPGADAAMVQQAATLRQMVAEWGQRANLFASLSSLPVGIPSLMAGRMPVTSPLGRLIGAQVSGFAEALLLWLMLTTLGLGLGSAWHIWAARQVAPAEEISSAGRAWLRMVILTVGAYAVVIGVMLITLIAVTAVLVILPSQGWLGMLFVFLGFSSVFWLAVYLMFSPHGVVRYRFGVLRAVLESVQVVRWNLLSTSVFIGLAVLVTWLTNWVWSLPEDNSWFTLLAVAGHSLVSATLVVGSYAYYQNRREWMLRVREGLRARKADETLPPGGGRP